MLGAPWKKAGESLTQRRGVRRAKKERAERKNKERTRHGSEDPPLQGTGRFRPVRLRSGQEAGPTKAGKPRRLAFLLAGRGNGRGLCEGPKRGRTRRGL